MEHVLWENGAPGFEDRKNVPSLSKDWWIKNIHNPSITVYQPEEGKANGTAVVIFPGRVTGNWYSTQRAEILICILAHWV